MNTANPGGVEMDDWPPDDTIIDDEERPERDDEPSTSVRHDRFSEFVGDALERML